MLAVGRPADLTIFDGKLAPERDRCSTRKVDYTIVDGEIVYAARWRQDAGGH